MKTFIKKYGIWLVSAAALFYVFSKLDWHEFLHYLKAISIFDVLLLILIYLLGFIPRALRSKMMLPALSPNGAMGGVMIGYAANNLLPARLGELVRAQLVGTVEGIRRSTTLSSIVFERVLDGFVIVILLFIGCSNLALPAWAEKARWSGLILFSCLLLGFLVSGFFPNFFRRFLPKGGLGQFIEGAIEGAAIGCRSIGALSVIVLLSFLTWIIETGMFYYCFRIFGIQQSFLAALFVLGVINLGILIPNSPGNVGVFEGFTILALEVFAVSKAQATAYSVVIHLCQYIPVTMIGLFYLSFFGFKSFSELKGSKTD